MNSKYTDGDRPLGNNSPTMIKLLGFQKNFFEELRVKGRSINTLKNYKTDLDCFNNYLLVSQKSLSIDGFSIPEILEYGKYLENKYKSDNSRRRRIQALRLFFDYLVEKMIFSDNPVKKIPTSPKFLDIPRPTQFSHVKTLWMYLLGQEKSQGSNIDLLKVKRNQIIFLLIYGSALQVSDISNLCSEHFSFSKNNRVMILHPKRDPYSVLLCDIFKKIYESYIALYEKVKKEHSQSFKKLLFNANAHRILNGGISARGIELIFDGWRKELLIDVTPKSLRQSAIFTWLHKGESETIIKEWLGVAPSYSLKLYRDHQHSHVFSDHFLEKCYLDFISDGRS